MIRYIAADLPIIEQALKVYIDAIRADPTFATIPHGTASYNLVHDGLEQAERLLARTRTELKASSGPQKAPAPVTSPTPGVTL